MQKSYDYIIGLAISVFMFILSACCYKLKNINPRLTSVNKTLGIKIFLIKVSNINMRD